MAASLLISAVENYVTGFNDSAFKEICQRFYILKETNLKVKHQRKDAYKQLFSDALSLNSYGEALQVKNERFCQLFKLANKELIGKETTLTDVAEKLGVFLTNKDTAVRSRGTRLLAEILNNLPADFLSQKEGSLLTVFLCERLQDHHSLQPHSLYGLLALSKANNLPNDCVEKICRTIFKEVHCQSLPQGDRRAIFTIISTFLHTKLSELQKIGADFVYGYLQAMDGEKDPRNLVLAFQCARKVMENFSLGVFTEEMFEVVSCYFPIDFTPSEKDSSGITKEELILGLRQCLAATPQFAQYCLRLLLEKLTSDLKSAKIDSLETLAVCADVYGSGSLQEYQSTFFNCIKKEVFLSGDPVVEEGALSALTALVKALSTGIIEVGTKRGLEGYVEEILTEVKQHLLQPELMLMLSTGRLLKATAQGSSTACCQVLSTAAPMLLEVHSRQTEATPKYNVLQVLTGLTETVSDFKSSSQCLDTVNHFKDQLITIYMSAIRGSVQLIQQQAVRGFKALFSIPSLLTENQMTSIGNTLILKVCEKDLDKDVRQKCNELFQYISGVQTQVVLKSLMYAVFPLVTPESVVTEGIVIESNSDGLEMDYSDTSPQNRLGELPNETGDAGIRIQSYDSKDIFEEVESEFKFVTAQDKAKLLTENIDILETLSVVCTSVTVVKVVTKFLLEYLFYCKESTSETCRAIFHCFTAIVDNSDTETLEYLYSHIVPAFYNWVISHCHSEGWQDRARDDVVLQHIAAVLRKTVTRLSSKHDSIFPAAYSKYCALLYLDGDISSVVSHNSKVLNQKFSPLLPGEDCIYVSLLTPILCSGPTKVEIPRGKEFIDRLSALAETVSDVTMHTHVIECCAGLVNKWKNEEELIGLLERIKSHVETILQSCDDDSKKTLAVHYWSWTTKALVLRNHKLSASFTGRLIDLLADIPVGKVAAEGIATILTPCDAVMTKEMSANIRMMYRQRFFMENLPKLAQGFESATQDCRKNYLLAVSYLIKEMDKQVLMPELDKVFPLLIHSLQCDEIDLQLSTMLTLGDLIQNAPELVHKQIDALVPKLLKLTIYKPSMKVRMAALKCIEELTTLPVHIVIPYRSKITRALETALDDPKRLVRQRAVSARQEWYLLDTKSK